MIEFYTLVRINDASVPKSKTAQNFWLSIFIRQDFGLVANSFKYRCIVIIITIITTSLLVSVLFSVIGLLLFGNQKRICYKENPF